MKAIYFDGKAKRLIYRDDIPIPEPARGEALIKVVKAGICRTDLEITKGYMGFDGIPGHEFVGVVEKSDDDSLTGSRVVGEINCGCGVCGACMHGDKNHCSARSVLGIKGRNGVFAEYTTLPVENLHHVPDFVSDDEAVFVEPLAAAYRVVEQVIIRGKSILVLGDGRLGLLIAKVAAVIRGNVTLCGRHPEKLALAGGKEIATLLESELKNDRQYDIVIDATGNPDGVAIALSHTRPRGQLILKTTVSEPVKMDLNKVVIDEISVIGSRCGPFEHALALLEMKEIDVTMLIQKKFKLEQGLEAFEAAAKPGALKILLG
ncbi:MAG: alcohol dehydrogenase catalytic domain-containing protein [Nitrospinota bacterium]